MKRNTSSRQQIVRELSAQGKGARQIAETLPLLGVTNPTTGKAFSEKTVRKDMAAIVEIVQQPAVQPAVSEMIGQSQYGGTYGTPFWPRFSYPVDSARADYAFWDTLRRGKAMGFELGGLFCQPIVQTLSAWTIGLLPTAALIEGGDPKAGLADDRNYTDSLLNRFLAHYHALLLKLEEDKAALGDQFVIVNADGTLSVPSPDTVTVDFAPNDYRTPIGYRIKTRYHGALIVDEYQLGLRKVSMNVGGYGDREYENLLGRLPVVHFSNDRSANEQFGRPVYEGAYRLFSRFDDLLEKAVDGAELSGNPIPVFEGMENVKETVALNSNPTDETYTDPTGATRNRTVIEFDKLAAIFVGKGGTFSLKAATPGFSDDILAVLGQLDSLISRYSRIPGFLYGGSAPPSKNDAEWQIKTFTQYVRMRQIQLAGIPGDPELNIHPSGGLYELITLWLQTRALTDPRVVVAPVKLMWPDLTAEDAQITLSKTIWARGVGLLDREDALTQLNLVEDPKRAIQKAEEDAAQQALQTNNNADNAAGSNSFEARMMFDSQHSSQFGSTPDSRKTDVVQNPGGGKPVGKEAQMEADDLKAVAG